MKTISFKVSEEEADYIYRAAKRERLSLSEYLRQRAVGPVKEGGVDTVRCELTGAEIFAPLPGGEPLTTEDVRELLADFP